jgi:SEL1 protein
MFWTKVCFTTLLLVFFYILNLFLDKSILRLTRFSPTTPSNETARLALTQWTRAAGQRNIDALVKVGDYYYHGLGVWEDTEPARFEKAAKYYQSAADQQSALAMWNLGWMYENGVGVPQVRIRQPNRCCVLNIPQDFHLAKRHYDLALETNAEASFPVYLSLVKLYARSIWHTITGGQGGLNIWTLDDDEYCEFFPHPFSTDLNRLIQCLPNLLRYGRSIPKPTKMPRKILLWNKTEPILMTRTTGTLAKLGRNSGDGTPSLRKQRTRTQFRFLISFILHISFAEHTWQWAVDRRNAEADRETEFAPDDYLGGRPEEDDEFSDTVLLLLLCLAVSVLIYVRTRIVDRMRRDQQQQQPQPAGEAAPAAGANGVFPPPGPDRDEWAVLR